MILCYSVLLCVTLCYSVLLCVTWCCVLIPITQELQQQLQRLMNDKARLEERVRDLEAEKNTLEVHMRTLLSHGSHMTII